MNGLNFILKNIYIWIIVKKVNMQKKQRNKKIFPIKNKKLISKMRTFEVVEYNKNINKEKNN